MAKRARRKEQPQLSPAPKHPATRGGPARGTRAEALDLIFESAIADAEGFRHGALGMPRVGKTYHMQEVVSEAQARGIASVALIHDVKKREPQYEGIVRADPADLRARPPGDDDPAVVVFHPSPGAADIVTVEDVAQLGWQIGQGGQSVLVLPDELYHALKSRQTWAEQRSTVARTFREGSSQGISIAWTTQIPQSLPGEAIDLSETVALFHLEGRSASYAVDAFRLPPDAEALLGRLDRGEFLLFSAFRGWDGKVYGPR